MAALSTANATRHVFGDCGVHFFTYASVNDNDTITLPGISQILDVTVTPTTAVASGATWTSAGVVTIRTTNGTAMTIMVISRVG